ncbi:putative mitochondrial protein, partial [Mucuna pruriens]
MLSFMDTWMKGCVQIYDGTVWSQMISLIVVWKIHPDYINLGSHGDHTFFIKHFCDDKLTLLLVSMEDMIVIGNDETKKKVLREKLRILFEMKELRKLKYFLGLEVAYSRQGHLGCKTFRVPIEHNYKIGSEEKRLTAEMSQYQKLQLVGKLIYLSHTRQDIAYVLSVISQFMNDPQRETLESKSRKRIITQKRRHTIYGGVYRCTLCWKIHEYMFLGGNLVTWRSEKQNVVAQSVSEAEFRAMEHSICVRHFTKDKLDKGLIIIAYVPSGLPIGRCIHQGAPYSEIP